MKLVKHDEGVEFEVKGQVHCYGVNKVSVGKDTKRLSVGTSIFLPNGYAETQSSSRERAYYVLSGLLEVKGKNQQYVASPGHLVYVAAGEERAFKVVGTAPANVIVIVVDI
jgi:quercetin dioxygenase-like cupin family protein